MLLEMRWIQGPTTTELTVDNLNLVRVVPHAESRYPS